MYAECLGDTKKVCKLSGVSLATLYRNLNKNSHGKVYHPVKANLISDHVKEKLAFFGVSQAQQRLQNIHHNWAWVYETAHKNFRARIKQLHPDATASTARLEQYHKVTQAWEHVERYLKSKM